MNSLVLVTLAVIVAAILGILSVGALGIPVTFATVISALGVGAVASIVRSWPRGKG